MDKLTKISLFLLICRSVICENAKFPSDFLFGVSSSAYQIEGGFDQRGETMFDYYQRLNSSLVVDSSDAKIACDSYNHYKEDIALVKDLGVNFYRFSIAWPRILPTGYPNQINPDGIRYYNNIIDGLLAANIEPMVTIFHYDLPKAMHDLGGWMNPVVSDFFEDYARILFQNFGDRVKSWITINTNVWGCGDADGPPRLNKSGIGDYLCLKANLLAHAKAYRLYQNEFKAGQDGKIGITIDGAFYAPGTTSSEDVQAAERANQFHIGMWANPIFGNGDFPQIMKERIDKLSQEEGFFKSRLPKLSQDEKNLLKGSLDFLGLNYYTTYLVKDAAYQGQKEPSLLKDIGVIEYQDDNWERGNSAWLKVTPWGFRDVLKWIKENYGNPSVFITENGFSDDGQLDDDGRIGYYKVYLKALLEAIHEDKVQVKGYAAWSLLDNFEWLQGYTEKFGLYHVDFSDPNRKRTPKSSARWYKKLIERRQLDDTIRTEL